MTASRRRRRCRVAGSLGFGGTRPMQAVGQLVDGSCMTRQQQIVGQLAALAQETRLCVFRLLVQAGPDGLPAGEIAQRLGVPASTLSFHLKELDHAGLVRSRRAQRQIFYAADYERMRLLLTFLTADCCQGRPEICAGLVEAIAACGAGCASEGLPA